MNTNVGTYEGVSRLILAIVIDSAVLSLAQMPPWIAMAAIYFFFTALIQWDPFYALFNALRPQHDGDVMPHGTSHGVSA